MILLRRKKILYVCTKPYAREIIEREAKRSKNHYVNFRWLGGTLTNSVTQTIYKKTRRNCIDQRITIQCNSFFMKYL